MGVTPLVSLPSSVHVNFLFGPCTQDHFIERMQHSTSPSPPHLHPALFPNSSLAQAADAKSLCALQRPAGIEVTPEILFFLLKKLKGSTFRREIVILYYPLPTSGRWRSEKNAVCEVNINVTIDVSWKRFRLLFLNQRNPSLFIKVMIIFLYFWFGFFFWSNICTSFQPLLLPDLYQMTLPRSSYLVPSCQASPSFTSCMGADLFAL